MRPTHHYSERIHGYRGVEFEADILGEINISDPKIHEELMRLVENPQRPYLPYRKAIEFAKKFQPGGDPANPQKDFLRELRLSIAEKLILDSDDELEGLGAYTAVGTPLDIFHGVDGFIVFKFPGQEEIVVTLDATLSRAKAEEGGKADIIISDLPAADEDEQGYLAAIAATADQVVGKIKEKQRREAELDKQTTMSYD